MLSLNLLPIFQARGIEKPFSYMVKKGFTPHATYVLLNSKGRSFRLDHIEKLCEVLICEPNDLLVWTPEKDTTCQPDHPLYKLTQQISVQDWKQSLASMPLHKLKNLVIIEQQQQTITPVSS